MIACSGGPRTTMVMMKNKALLIVASSALNSEVNIGLAIFAAINIWSNVRSCWLPTKASKEKRHAGHSSVGPLYFGTHASNFDS